MTMTTPKPTPQPYVYRSVLKCGLCGYERTDTFGIDRQLFMTAHWRMDHFDCMVPVFNQDTWRTSVVQPLGYVPQQKKPV